MMSRPLHAEHTGGAKQQGRTRAEQRAARAEPRNRPRSFRDLWHTLPLHRLVVIALPTDIDTMDVTVAIHDRLRHTLDLRMGVHFQVSKTRARNPGLLEADIAQALAGLQWDNFRDVILTDSDDDCK